MTTNQSDNLCPCPFCEANNWQYQSHFSALTIRQCEGCGTVVDESVINSRPIEDKLNARIAELEAIADKLGNALTATYNKLPTHWRGADWCPYDYPALMVELNRLKESEK